MGDAGDAVHRGLNWNRHLLLDLLGGDSRPLRDDIDVVVGYVGIGLHRKPVERHDPPHKQQDADGQDEKAVLQREVDEPTNHCASTVA